MEKIIVDGEIWNAELMMDAYLYEYRIRCTRQSDGKQLILKEDSRFGSLDDINKIRLLSTRISNILDTENKVDEIIKDIPSKKQNKIDTIIGLLQEISSKLGD